VGLVDKTKTHTKMRKYQRSQEKIRTSMEIETIIDFLEEVLRDELMSCTEYQVSERGDHFDKTFDKPEEWFGLWQDAVMVLHKKQYNYHQCSCHGSLFNFTVSYHPSFTKDIWRF